MRKSLIGLVVVTLMAFGASAANAVTAGWQVIGTTGTAVCSGLACDAQPGDTITIINLVDNTAGPDAIISLFTTMRFDQGVIDLTGGGSGAILQDGFGGPELVVIAQPAQKFGRPAGEFIALAHASTSGATSATGPEPASQLVFTVTGFGVTNLSQFIGVGDDSLINGESNVPGDSPGISFGPDLVVTVIPEPGTALLMGLGLTGLSMAGRRRRA